MQEKEILSLLNGVKNGNINVNEALKKIKNLPFEDIEFAKIDHHRELRIGYPEVIYGEGKSDEQIIAITQKMLENKSNILITRTKKSVFELIKQIAPNAHFNELGRTISVKIKNIPIPKSYIAIVSAGTSDIGVVEEAYESAVILGNEVKKVIDVGVAGIHRLLNKLEILQNAKVVIVIAGMEGALASVVGGLVNAPIIAVPTSVGYGANFGGISALLSMLNSCASGVSVVNIDNGFGAAYSASIINHL